MTLRAALLGFLIAVGGAGSASGQVALRPEPSPSVTAETAQWYQAGEPILFGGTAYYRAGPRVFFDGKIMVPVGTFSGVTLYMNTTIEPNSQILVPGEGGQMQPYERRRSGDLAGTTASSAPSFPVESAPYASQRVGVSILANVPQIAGPPLQEGAIARNVPQVSDTLPTSPVARDFPQTPAPTGRPVGTSGGLIKPPLIWITYQGQRWEPAGRAMPFTQRDFEIRGDYRGFPVYVRPGTEILQVIYLPSSPGFVAPYRRVN